MGKQDIDQEAAEWMARLDDIDRPPDFRDQREWMSWLKRSPKHVQAYFDVANVSQMVDEVPRAGRARLREMLAAHRQQPLSVAGEQLLREDGSWLTGGVKLAAAAAVACMIAGSLWLMMASPRYAAGVGKQASYTLPDGSSMLLNTRSRARISMSERERLVELDGEALFTVARDKDRPFRVRTHSAVTQAVGTQFNVYERNDGTTKVSVLEGAVKVSPIAESADSAPLLLSAGQEGEVHESRLTRASAPKVSASIAWKNGTLVFEDAPIGEVAAQFNRYNETQFSISPQLGSERRLSGTFDADHPEYFRAFLERDDSLEVWEKGGVVYVSAKGSASTN